MLAQHAQSHGSNPQYCIKPRRGVCTYNIMPALGGRGRSIRGSGSFSATEQVQSWPGLQRPCLRRKKGIVNGDRVNKVARGPSQKGFQFLGELGIRSQREAGNPGTSDFMGKGLAPQHCLPHSSRQSLPWVPREKSQDSRE